jgi:hypothetical protein
VLSTSSIPAAAATSRIAIGAIINYSKSILLPNRVSVSREVYSGAGSELVKRVLDRRPHDSIAEQDITAPADGELVPVDARGWLGGERAPGMPTNSRQ